MNRVSLILVFLISLVAIPTQSDADVTGEWIVEFKSESRSDWDSGECTLREANGVVNGTCGRASITGNVKDRQISWQFRFGPNDETLAIFTGEVDARSSEINGSWQAVDESEGSTIKGTFIARKR